MKYRNNIVVLDDLAIENAIDLVTTRALRFLRSAPPVAPTTSAVLAELDEVAAGLKAGRPLVQPSFGSDLLKHAVRVADEPCNQAVGLGFLKAIAVALELRRNEREPIDPFTFLDILSELQAAVDDDDDCPPWHGLISRDLNARTFGVTPRGVDALRLRGVIRMPSQWTPTSQTDIFPHFKEK